MELTLDEALKRGVAAHEAGELQEADKLYTAILNVQSKHPDANHNMGILAVGVGKLEQALPYFKTAVEVNPSIEQYWISYIKTLIDLDQIDEAKTSFLQARKSCISGDLFDRFEETLNQQQVGANSSRNQDPPRHLIQSAIDLYNQGQFQQTLDRIKQLFEEFPKSVVLFNLQGAGHAGLGDLDGAINSFRHAVKIKPDFADAYNNLGAALRQKGGLDEAISCYKQAINIKPNFSDAHYNNGNALKQKGALDEAISSYRQAIKIKPDYAEAYNNMGFVLQEKGALDEAISSCRQAINIKPDFADAYSNLGNALTEKGALDQAISSYKQAIKIKPDFADVYSNMGAAFREKGALDEAISNYRQAIKIEPHHNRAWDNLSLVLRASKPQSLSLEEQLYLPQDKNLSKSIQISASILKYRLNQGGPIAESCFNDIINLLVMDKSASIKNSKPNITEIGAKPRPQETIVGLLHFGRSGTGLIHSLIDDHPQVSTLPSIYLSEFFDVAAWERIIGGGWDQIPDRFIAMYPVLFDATATNPVSTFGGNLIYSIGEREGMTQVGAGKDESLCLDRICFRSELHRVMSHYGQLDPFVFFQLVHLAYEKALTNYNEKKVLFYHIHNPDTYAKLNFVRYAPNAKWLMMVREPIQCCESLVHRYFNRGDYLVVASHLVLTLFQVDDVIFRNQESVGVRLEDLKERPKAVMLALCDWMGIDEEESLYEMTAQGKKWWGDPSSPDYGTEAMTPFGDASIKRKVGSVFSHNDQFILRTLFYPFSVRFGYMDENLEQFKIDLQSIRPMLDATFDFEKVLVKKMQVDVQQFIKAGSYQYLRTCLIERWNTLDEFKTYPHMLEPLPIGIPINHD